jgi:hypothetical protein
VNLLFGAFKGVGEKNTPGVGGPTPGGTAGGLYSYFFLVFAFALGFAAAAFFFGAAFFFVAANSLTPFQIIQSCPSLRVRRLWLKISRD